MFETSMVHPQARVARRRAGLFTISLIAHTVVILGAAAISVASVEFPVAAPDEVANAPLFVQVQIPPPLGNPNGGAPPRPQPEQRQATPPPPTQPTAPAIIPDETPVADTPGDSTTTATGPSTGDGRVQGPVGVPWGDPNSIETNLDLPPVTNTAPAVEEKIHVVGGEVKAPVAIHKVAPEYPRGLRPTGMTATVVVRCIIDKNGHVQNPQIVSGSLPPFNAETMKAVQQWRFTPGSYRGQAVDVYFDLTVTFRVTR